MLRKLSLVLLGLAAACQVSAIPASRADAVRSASVKSETIELQRPAVKPVWQVAAAPRNNCQRLCLAELKACQRAGLLGCEEEAQFCLADCQI